jgi:hypothetical protein
VYACWVGIVHTVLLRAHVFRLKSSPALLLQLPFASLFPAPGIVIVRDGCGLGAEGACTYALARPACGTSDSSTWSSSTTTPITTLVSRSLDERVLHCFDRERDNVRCSIPSTERCRQRRPAMRCTWVTCSLSALRPASSRNDDSSLNESAL